MMTTNRCLRWTPTLASLLLLFSAGALSESIRYAPVTRNVIQARLRSYTGTDAQRETTLKRLFSEAGCAGLQLNEQRVQFATLPNVICTLPGASESTIIVGAHFDHVPAGDGVVDNWSGASLLPSLYEAVKEEPRQHTYVFVGFTDEEKGEVGSRFYAQHMTKEQIATTDAMVNMDTLGLAPTEIWVSHSDKRLTGALVYFAKLLKMPISGVDVDRIGSTDSVQFAAVSIPSITIHSLTQETWNQRILHTAKDRITAIRMDDYYQTYRLLSGYLAFLDTLSHSNSH